MSDTYTKLFSSITASTVWQEPAGTRLVWITMLAMADKAGCVWASVPGLARIANVTLDETVEAINTFTAPDKWSRTPDNEGRRIEAIDGGWRLLNHSKYRAIRSAEERAEYKRNWDRENRAGRPNAAYRDDITPDSPRQTPTNPTGATPPTPTPTPTPEKSEEHVDPADAGRRAPPPYAEIMAAYNRELRMLPEAQKMTDGRRKAIKTRWHEDEERQSLDWWERFFAYVRTECPFLTKSRFCTFDWLLCPSNMVKVQEGNYEDKAA